MLKGVARRATWRLGRRIYCLARGEGVNRLEVNGELYVQNSVLAAKDVVNPTVFDVGANVGEWTRSFIKQIERRSHGGAKIWAFEPSPASFKHISERFISNPEVHCVQVALSDAVGHDRLLIEGETSGTNTLVFDSDMEESATRSIDVMKTTADIFCDEQDISHIHLLKCDTEGHDLSVIRGANRLLLGERIDVLQFEYNHRWIYARSFLKDVFDFVSGSGYTIAAIRRSRIELLRHWHPELERFFEANYLIIHERALPWFDVLDGRFDASNAYA